MTLKFADYTRFMMPLLSPEGDGGAGGGEGAGNEKPGAGGDGTGKPGDNNSQDRNAAGDKGGDGNRGGTPRPDRQTEGILKDLQKERTTRQGLETKLTTLQSQLEQATKRIHALAGVNTPTEQEADEAAIKDALIKRFPALGKLTEEKLDQLLQLTDKADAIEESSLRQWTNHARGMLDGVISGVSKEMGGDLTDRQKKNLQQAYLLRAQNDEDFLARHEQGDRTLIDEFVKEYVEDWIAPSRRVAAADTNGRRRPVPSGKDRSAAGAGGGKKIDYTNPKAVEDAMVASFREHGGSFGD